MGNIENGMGNLNDMFTSYLTKAVNMFTGSEMAGRSKMLKGLRGIGKLNLSEERLMDLDARIEELENSQTRN